MQLALKGENEGRKGKKHAGGREERKTWCWGKDPPFGGSHWPVPLLGQDWSTGCQDDFPPWLLADEQHKAHFCLLLWHPSANRQGIRLHPARILFLWELTYWQNRILGKTEKGAYGETIKKEKLLLWLTFETLTVGSSAKDLANN